MVNREHLDRDSSDVRQTDQREVLILKVGCPIVAARVQKSHEKPGVGIDPSNVWPLELIASRTTEREVGNLSLAPMLAGDDVVQHMPHARRTLGDSAIFAAIARKTSDNLFYGFRHAGLMPLTPVLMRAVPWRAGW